MSSTSPKILDDLFVRVCTKLKSHDKQLKANFQTLPTNFDRFKFIWCLGPLHTEIDTVLARDYYDPKDTDKSNEFRQKGNDLYAKKRFDEAILKYNVSIQYGVSPKLKSGAGGEALQGLGTSYANRSAAFFQLNEFQLCLVDIENALANGYSAALRPKLIERKLASLYRLGNYDRVLETIAEEKGLELDVFKQYLKNIEEVKRKREKEDKVRKPLNSDFKMYRIF
jgi:hypothetical protein